MLIHPARVTTHAPENTGSYKILNPHVLRTDNRIKHCAAEIFGHNSLQGCNQPDNCTFDGCAIPD